jgi:hypothetical protein
MGLYEILFEENRVDEIPMTKEPNPNQIPMTKAQWRQSQTTAGCSLVIGHFLRGLFVPNGK